MRTLCGRADLLRALAETPTANTDALASLLGYVRPDPLPEPPSVALPTSRIVADLPTQSPSSSGDAASSFDIPFWQPVRREYTPDAVPLDNPNPPRPARFDLKPEPTTRWPDQPAALPPWPSLTPRPNLLTRLRSPLARHHPTGGPDIAAAIQRLARAQQLDHLPRRRLRRWGSALQIIDDRSRRLTPFWSDQDEVSQWLSALYPRDAITHGRYLEGLTEPLLFDAQGALVNDYILPPADTPVLVLGDLGCLEPWPSTRRFWRRFGEKLRAAGCQPVALLPCGPDHWPSDLARLWTMIDWEQFRAPPAPPTEPPVERLLRLLAPAIRIEPGLLRQIRRLPCAGGADASAEADFWQHSALSSPHSVAASFHPDPANDRRRDFIALPLADQAAALACIRTWRATISPDVWFEEILSQPEAHRHGVSSTDIDAARTRFHNLSLIAYQEPSHLQSLAAGVRGLLRRLPPDLPADFRPVADLFWAFLKQHGLAPAEQPSWGEIDPANLPPTHAAPRRYSLYHRGDTLQVEPADEDLFAFDNSLLSGPDKLSGNPAKPVALTGSPIATLTSRNGLITIAGRNYSLTGTLTTPLQPPVAPLIIRTDQETLSLDSLTQPSWADAIGRDRYGLWCQITVKGVAQKLRWIPPSRFLMGSPEDEGGRRNNEGPQREVVMADGFWLFDTPCTQALWVAVMGKNPSQFKGDKRRPVESVSWQDVQIFLDRINRLMPGVNLTLPSERQWEYACRAGTSTATYGPLAEIAWYGDNNQNTTRLVGGRAANDWGLYDMLGNVWEWCADLYWPYGTGSAAETGPLETETALRVVRGGSWGLSARDVRAAARNHFHQQNRSHNLGFRCALAQGEGAVWSGEPGWRSAGGARPDSAAEPPPQKANAAQRRGGINADALFHHSGAG